MTVYMVTDPATGRKVKLTGDSPPTDAELEEIFGSLPEVKRSFGDKALGLLETAATIASSAIAEPAAGIAGLGTTLLTGSIGPSGLTGDPAAGAAVVEGVRNSLTYNPRGDEGKENIQAVGEFIAPAAEVFAGAENALGDTTLAVTGSPAAAAIAKTIPTALLELAGASVAKGVSKLKTGRELNEVIERSTPTVDELKAASSAVFKEIDDLGAKVNPGSFAALTDSIEKAAKGVGASQRTTPQAFGIIEDFKEVAARGTPIGLEELEELRTVANNVAKTIDPAQQAPALAIIDEIDNFLYRSGPGIIDMPAGGPNIGGEYRAARNMWGRARRGELLEEAFVKAEDTASGFENGLRIEFRKILKNKRQSKFFNADEKAAMRQVSVGTSATNLAKLIGKMGFSEKQATQLVNPLMSGGVAGLLFGPAAGIAAPLVGQASKKLAQKLTRNNGMLAQRVVKAGTNAEDIAKAYIFNTPKADRSVLELAELFVRNKADAATATSAFAKDAADVAKQSIAFRQGALAGGLFKPPEERRQ